MRRRWRGLSVAVALMGPLVLAAPVAAQSVVIGPFEVVDRPAFERQAGAAWQGVNKGDAASLDRFIARFPGARQALVGFALRLELLRTSGMVHDYEDFIDRHAHRFVAYQLIGELYRKTRSLDRVSAYLRFVHHYPNSPHAAAATLRAQHLFAGYAAKADEVEVYDDFLQLFPDAPQAHAIVSAARDRFVRRERAAARRLCGKRFVAGGHHGRRCNSRLERRLSRLLARRNTLAARGGKGDKLIAAYVAQAVMSAGVYDETRRLADFGDRHLIASQLEQLRRDIERLRRDLIGTIRRELAATRLTLQRGFARVVRNQRLLNATLERGFGEVSAGLAQVNQQLAAIHGAVGKLSTQLQQANAHLAGLDQRLAGLDRAMGQVAGQLHGLRGDIDRNHGQLLAEQRQAREAIVTSVRRMRTTMERQGDVQINALQAANRALARGNRLSERQVEVARTRLAQAGAAAVHQLRWLKRIHRDANRNAFVQQRLQRQTIGAVEVVGDNVWASGRATAEAIRQLGHRMQAARQPGGAGGVLGGIVKGVFSKVPFVGDELGAATSSFVDNLVSGKSIAASGAAALEGAVAQRFPGVLGALRTVADGAAGERRRSYASHVRRLCRDERMVDRRQRRRCSKAVSYAAAGRFGRANKVLLKAGVPAGIVGTAADFLETF